MRPRQSPLASTWSSSDAEQCEKWSEPSFFGEEEVVSEQLAVKIGLFVLTPCRSSCGGYRRPNGRRYPRTCGVGRNVAAAEGDVMMKRSVANRLGALVVSILCVALSAGSHEASGGTIRVPADQPTIQAAIDAAISGDEVVVAPGRYTGSGNKNIQIQLKDVAVRSETGPAETVIDCEASGRAFFIAGANAPLALIEGFTLENGDGNGADPIGGGAIFIGGGSPIIRNCVFRRNIAGDTYTGAGGGGGLVSHGSTAT